MPRPKPDEETVQIALRVAASRLARIDAYAKEHALSRNLAIAVLIDAGLAPSVAAKPRKPLYEQVAECAPLPKAPAPSASLKLHVGPIRPAYGALAKKGKR